MSMITGGLHGMADVDWASSFFFQGSPRNSASTPCNGARAEHSNAAVWLGFSGETSKAVS